MFPNDYFPADGWIEYETPLSAANLNIRDNEIRAIELALGRTIIPTGTVSLDSWLHVTGTPSELTFPLGAMCVGLFKVFLASNNATIGIHAANPYYGMRIDMSTDCTTSWTREVSWAWGGSKIASVGHIATGATPEYVYINANQGGETLGYSTPQFVVRASGNVGIGTTNPAARLEVAGSVKLGVDRYSGLGFFGTAPHDQPTVSSSGTAEEQVASLRNALLSLGLIRV